MAAQARKEERFIRLSEICLSLPRATREDKGEHSAFLVGKKVFAYYLDNHHGDGIVGVSCKVLAGENRLLVDTNPEKFYMPAYVASRGWVGLRLDLPKLDWTEIKELVRGSYLQIAPARLAALVK
jgi:predicted DNA-binding protein (MmcQ/YjbR family)